VNNLRPAPACRVLAVHHVPACLPGGEPFRYGASLTIISGVDPLAYLLRQLDDDSLRAADVAEPVAVLVALQLADEFSAAGSQAGNGGVDVVDGECNVADTWRVRRRAGCRPGLMVSGTS